MLTLFLAAILVDHKGNPTWCFHTVGSVNFCAYLKFGKKGHIPKLHIARFKGTYEDYPRFWNQLVEMPNVTKFADFKSYLDFKVRKCGKVCRFQARDTTLPRTRPVWKRLRSYHIFELPTISNTNTQGIHKFNGTLAFCLQSMQML